MIERWMDGWNDRKMDGWMDGMIDRKMDGYDYNFIHETDDITSHSLLLT